MYNFSYKKSYQIFTTTSSYRWHSAVVWPNSKFSTVHSQVMVGSCSMELRVQFSTGKKPCDKTLVNGILCTPTLANWRSRVIPSWTATYSHLIVYCSRVSLAPKYRKLGNFCYISLESFLCWKIFVGSMSYKNILTWKFSNIALHRVDTRTSLSQLVHLGCM